MSGLESADRLVFYSRSADVRPCKGKNEVGDPSKYAELAGIKDWRKVLSNFHVAPFVYRGKTYNTIEHGFQAAKIALVDPGKADLFAMESGSELSRGDGGVAQKHRKMVMLSKDELAQWAGIKDVVMFGLALEKFKACAEATEVLKHTGSAQLWHQVNRGKPVRFEHLETIRSMI